MDKTNFSIAIDGPSCSGKSTIAKLLSKKLGILYLDTGAMYRASALAATRRGIDVTDERKVAAFIEDIDLEIKYVNGAQVTMLGSEDVSEAIRLPEMSMLASNISAHKCCRIKMVEMQREIAKKMSCVLDGRDIGTFVLPNARYKFFLTATAEIRAKRRYDELTAKGFTVELNKLIEETIQRDYNDSHREFAPLKKADDAIEIDTSLLSIEEVSAKILSYIERES